MLDVDATITDGTCVVRLRGEFDMGGRELFRSEAAEALALAPKEIVLDLSSLTFLDSSGIHEIVELRRSAAFKGIKFWCRVGEGIVERVLSLTGLLDSLRKPETG